MKKRVASKVSVASKLSDSRTADDSNDVTRSGFFTFPNGDKYEGDYRIYGGQILVRHGRGVYDTDDFNRYEAAWDRDRISDDLHIRFNNGMEYKGGLDKDGNMSGRGTYFLPDGSLIAAVWNNNKPSLDILYEEPLGFIWKGELSADGDVRYKYEFFKDVRYKMNFLKWVDCRSFADGDEVRFTAGNHFWDDMYVSQDNK